MLENWEKIHQDSSTQRVELLRIFLESKGIDSVVLNKKDSMYHIGVSELYVPNDKAESAKTLLQDEFTAE